MSNPISNYTLEEFNLLLEDIKPLSKSSFNKVRPSSTLSLPKTPILYLSDLKLIICSECRYVIFPSSNSLKQHLKVSLTFKLTLRLFY